MSTRRQASSNGLPIPHARARRTSLIQRGRQARLCSNRTRVGWGRTIGGYEAIERTSIFFFLVLVRIIRYSDGVFHCAVFSVGGRERLDKFLWLYLILLRFIDISIGFEWNFVIFCDLVWFLIVWFDFVYLSYVEMTGFPFWSFFGEEAVRVFFIVNFLWFCVILLRFFWISSDFEWCLWFCAIFVCFGWFFGDFFLYCGDFVMYCVILFILFAISSDLSRFRAIFYDFMWFLFVWCDFMYVSYVEMKGFPFLCFFGRG